MPLLSSLLSALVMWFVIWVLMRRDGVVSMKPVLLICLAIWLVSLFAFKFLGSWGGLPVVGGLIFALNHWCFLPWLKAALVTVVWLAVQLAFGRFIAPIF